MSTVRRDGQKVYLEGVRKVSWDTGEMSEFASCFVAALESRGKAVTYPFVMGTSGTVFRFTLAPGAWDFSNYSFRNITPDPYAPARNAFAAAGYACTVVEPGSFAEDATTIMGSIEQGVPVLAFPVVGPSDCCIITGYDEEGQVLLGWSTFQNIPDDHNIPPDETGYFRKPGWHENLHGYILIGEKVSRPPLRTIYLDALKTAVRLFRAQELPPRVTGLEGMRAWAGEMVQEKYFPAGDEETLGWCYVSAAINMTMLRDHLLAEPFLCQVIEDVPDFQPELSGAITAYGEIKRLRAGMDDLIDDLFTEKAMRAIKDTGVRRQYADAILQICAAEEVAAQQIEQLIERCG